MSVNLANVDALVDEYGTYVSECSPAAPGMESVDVDSVRELLVRSGNWTEQGARAVTSLAHDYGAFILRNALALAIALEMEDGELGY